MKRKTVAAIFKKSFVSPISRDKFFIKIDDELNWKILPETIVITNLNCQKAGFTVVCEPLQVCKIRSSC